MVGIPALFYLAAAMKGTITDPFPFPQHQFADALGSVTSMLKGICDETNSLFDNEGIEGPS